VTPTPQFGTIQHVHAVKPYRCGKCGRKIEIGKVYEIQTGRDDARDWFIVRTCMVCVNSRDEEVDRGLLRR
jgi:hypothetical protein